KPETLDYKPHKLVQAAELFEPSNHLLGFAYWNARVIGSMDHQQRRPDALHAVDRRDIFQKLTVLLEAAVLRLTQVAPPRARVLEKRDEVGDTDQVDPRRPQLRVGGQRRKHHESAVAAAVHGDALRIGAAA